jgi:chemotaxis protein methyltransferase CheR
MEIPTLRAPKISLNEEQALKLLKRKILKKKGLKIDQYKTNYLKRRLAVRIRANKLDSYYDYISILNHFPKEYDLLLEDLTINVTEFFRDQNTFIIFKDLIIPNLILWKRKYNQKIIRAWSAGCASGEEPYSLAMLFHLVLGHNISNWLIKIYGTDIDYPSLEKAKNGRYEKIASFEGKELKEFFENDNSHYRLKDEIKNMVKFYYHDLASKSTFKCLDIILCRNVLIYFSADRQKELLYFFYQALNKRGYLILGKTEPILSKVRGLFSSVNARECIYQKLEEKR